MANEKFPAERRETAVWVEGTPHVPTNGFSNTKRQLRLQGALRRLDRRVPSCWDGIKRRGHG
jgi:hypothetical protein